ncbi:MAG: cupin domain-containing protein [Gaiellaceae bacterium]
MSEPHRNLIRVADGKTQLAWIFPAAYVPPQTEFPTPDSFTLQAGYIVYPAGGAVRPHRHRPIARTVTKTGEALFVKAGRAFADCYADDGHHVSTQEINEGDFILLIGGGHGFRMQEDTILIEVKQGPYFGLDEKEPL